MLIIGHQKIQNLLDKAIAKNSVSHAYLFYGPESVGKFTVALEFAKKLVGNSGMAINPDLIIVAPEVEEKKGIKKKLAIKIDQIDDLRHKLSLSRQGGGHKVAIIDEAERMNKSAQNSLLKTLEESGEGVILILVAHDKSKLLSTILSRCQKMRFGTVSDEEMVAALAENGDLINDELIFWSLGRPGRMKDLLSDKDKFVAVKEAIRDLEKLFRQSAVERLVLAEEMSKDITTLKEKLDLWSVFFREVLVGRQNASGISRKKALEAIEMIEESLELIKNTNSNARLILENLFISL